MKTFRLTSRENHGKLKKFLLRKRWKGSRVTYAIYDDFNQHSWSFWRRHTMKVNRLILDFARLNSFIVVFTQERTQWNVKIPHSLELGIFLC